MKNDVVKILGLFLLLVVLAFFTFSSFSLFSLSTQKTQPNAVLNVNNKETDFSLLGHGIQWTPDGHISYITFPDGKRRYFIAGNQRAYAVESNSSMSFAQTIKSNPVIEPVFGPNVNVLYRNNYSTIGDVLQIDPKNPYHVMAFTQNEQQALKQDGTYDYSNFTASIGLLESYDGGLTWKDLGPVIKGDDFLSPGIKISGAGEPSAIIKDGYVYIYFVDWSSQLRAPHQDQIYVARTKIFEGGVLGTFEFYTTNGFSNQESNLQPVISGSSLGSNYASLPSVSYNKYLGKYLAIYEVNSGFASVVSDDGLTWTDSKIIFSFPQAQSDRKQSNIWFSYPTFLSDESQANDQFTQKTGNLYFSKGIWPNDAHQPTVKYFEFK